MRILVPAILLFITGSAAFAQVDLESRRVAAVQSSFAVSKSEESTSVIGYFWFNENNYPWTNTALRVIFAGVFVDVELSVFLPASTNTAVGVGAGGGLFLEGITPYHDGEQLSQQGFNGDTANARFFINQTIPNPTPIPINLRATYGVSGGFYRDSGSTTNFVLPPDFLTQTVSAELRLGGIEPGLTATRGVELYIGLDANYRSGFKAFGPIGKAYPAQSQYERAFGSISGKIPAGPTIVFARIAGGWGDDLDQLSSWKLGGNMAGAEPVVYTLHGYYTREFFASDFGLANLDWSIPINRAKGLTGHCYADWAVVKPPPPEPDDWKHYFGIGAGLGFRGPWDTNGLLSYGYGFNAIRNGDHGGHEVGFALEKKF